MTTQLLTLTSPFCKSVSIWSTPGSSTWDWSRGNGKLWMASCQLCQVGTRVFSSLFWSNWRLEHRIVVPHLLRIELRSTLLETSYEGGASWKTSLKSPPSGFPTPAKFKPMKLPRSGRSEALQASLPPLPSQLRITPGSGEKLTLLSRAARKRG